MSTKYLSIIHPTVKIQELRKWWLEMNERVLRDLSHVTLRVAPSPDLCPLK